MYRDKGNKLNEFPDDFCVIDVKTTGLDPRYDEIIEMSALRIRDDVPVDSFTTMVHPDSQISTFTESFTGIPGSELENAPEIDEVLEDFTGFIGSDPVAGYDIHFAINFIYDMNYNLYREIFDNDFVDTARMSKRLCPELDSHTLADMLKHYTINKKSNNKSLTDCSNNFMLYENLKKEALKKYGTMINFKDSCKRTKIKYPDSVKASDIVTFFETDKTHPLYGKICVFEGTPEKMTTEENRHKVEAKGGLVDSTLSGRTNYLVISNNDYEAYNRSEAENLILKGQDLHIVSEDIFYDLADLY